MKDEDYLETKEFKNALKADQFHEEVAKECGPMIEEIASKHYPDLSPEELAQALHKDKTVGRIFTMFSLQTFIDDVAEETRTNN